MEELFKTTLIQYRIFITKSTERTCVHYCSNQWYQSLCKLYKGTFIEAQQVAQLLDNAWAWSDTMGCSRPSHFLAFCQACRGGNGCQSCHCPWWHRSAHPRSCSDSSSRGGTPTHELVPSAAKISPHLGECNVHLYLQYQITFCWLMNYSRYLQGSVVWSWYPLAFHFPLSCTGYKRSLQTAEVPGCLLRSWPCGRSSTTGSPSCLLRPASRWCDPFEIAWRWCWRRIHLDLENLAMLAVTRRLHSIIRYILFWHSYPVPFMTKFFRSLWMGATETTSVCRVAPPNLFRTTSLRRSMTWTWWNSLASSSLLSRMLWPKFLPMKSMESSLTRWTCGNACFRVV